jgi:UPF0755 protein
VRSEHHDSLEASDPHSLLFGPDDQHEAPDGAALRGTRDACPGEPQGSRRSRHSRQQQLRKQRRRRRLGTVAGLLVVVIVLAAGWFVARPLVEESLTPKDWTGAGVGQVLVEVKPNDTAGAIGSTLVKLGVVRTKRAFTNAASDNQNSRSIQPGFYRLRKHMAADQALALLLDPSAKVVSDVTIPEGSTEQNILARLAKALGVPPAKVAAAAANVGDLGLPEGYASGGAAPRSAEGFLFPDTYSLDPGTSPTDALQEMTSEFTGVDRDMGFADAAHKMKITPYEALTVASMIEGEAKFPDDRAKVARVVFNRLAKHMPLGIDATSVYGAELAGKNPANIDFNVPAPYNTRLKPGLPPTPIGNPGRAALTAAVVPAPGDWLYYVNGDAAGHLFFTADANAFAAAAQKCRQNHWGCS